MSRYQNNFKICKRVQTHQFTEPRRYVENTIGSLISNQIGQNLETGPVVENGLGNWRINITMRFFCMYNTTLLMHTMPTKKVWYNQKYQGRTLCNWRIWSFCSFTKRQKCSVDASDPQLSFNIQGVNKKVKNSILLVLHLKRVKMLF